MPPRASLTDCLEFAVTAARRAGEVIMPYYQGELGVEAKADGSPVTLADRAAERELRRLLGERFPDDGVLGEEYGEQPGTSGRRWILDPIDGTKAFVRGVPMFGVLIALEEDGDAVAGVAYVPPLDEMVYAARGLGCWWLPSGRKTDIPRRAHVSDTATLADGILLFTSYEYFVKSGRQAAFERMLRASKHQRGWGDCYGHLLVATGRAEACVDPIMNIWDNAALVPILLEAGGTFTDWTGQTTHQGGDGISTNGRVYDELMRSLKE
jgi:histidinol phosphatase-like enzyme (inositol monophosphatase family)